MIHIIYVVDVSISMTGSKIESALETIREISDTENNCYSIITFANSADIVCEYATFNYDLLNKINVCKGLSNFSAGIIIANQLMEKHKTPAIIICLTDSLFTSIISNSEFDNFLLLEKIIISYTKTSIAQLYAKDFSVFFNDENSLKEISKRIQTRSKKINNDQDNTEKETNNAIFLGKSEEVDFCYDKDDPKWS